MPNRVTDTAGRAVAVASDKIQEAGTAANEALGTARAKLGDALDSARSGADKALASAARGIEANPLAFVVGGIAAGAALAALLPRTKLENEVLGNTGGRLNDAALAAATAARDAGKEAFAEFGLGKDGIRTQIDKFVDTAAKAASSAGSAAVDAVRLK